MDRSQDVIDLGSDSTESQERSEEAFRQDDSDSGFYGEAPEEEDERDEEEEGEGEEGRDDQGEPGSSDNDEYFELDNLPENDHPYSAGKSLGGMQDVFDQERDAAEDGSAADGAEDDDQNASDEEHSDEFKIDMEEKREMFVKIMGQESFEDIGYHDTKLLAVAMSHINQLENEYESYHQEWEDEKKKYDEKLSSLEDERKALSIQVDTLRSENTGISERLSEHENRWKEIELQMSSGEVKPMENLGREAKLQALLQVLQDENQNMVELLNKRNIDAQHMQESLSHIQSKNSQLLQEKLSLGETLEMKKVENSSLQTRVSFLEKELLQSRSQYNQEFSASQLLRRDFETARDTNEKQLRKFEHEIVEYKTKMEVFQRRFTEKETECHELTLKLRILEANLEDSKAHKQEVEKVYRESMQTQNALIDASKEQIQVLEERISNITQNLSVRLDHSAMENPDDGPDSLNTSVLLQVLEGKRSDIKKLSDYSIMLQNKLADLSEENETLKRDYEHTSVILKEATEKLKKWESDHSQRSTASSFIMNSSRSIAGGLDETFNDTPRAVRSYNRDLEVKNTELIAEVARLNEQILSERSQYEQAFQNKLQTEINRVEVQFNELQQKRSDEIELISNIAGQRDEYRELLEQKSKEVEILKVYVLDRQAEVPLSLRNVLDQGKPVVDYIELYDKSRQHFSMELGKCKVEIDRIVKELEAVKSELAFERSKNGEFESRLGISALLQRKAEEESQLLKVSNDELKKEFCRIELEKKQLQEKFDERVKMQVMSSTEAKEVEIRYMQTKINELKNTLREVQIQRDQLKNEADSYGAELDTLKKCSFEKEQASIQALNHRSLELQTELNLAREEVIRLRTECAKESLRYELHVSDSSLKLADHKKVVSEKDLMISSLAKQIEAEKEKNVELRMQLSVYQRGEMRENNQFGKKYDQGNYESLISHQIRIELENAKIENQSLKDELFQKEQNVLEFQQISQSAEQELRNLQREFESFRQDNASKIASDSLKLQQAEANAEVLLLELRRIQDAKESEDNLLKKEISSLQKEKQRLEEEFSVLSRQNDVFKAQINELQAAIDALNEMQRNTQASYENELFIHAEDVLKLESANSLLQEAYSKIRTIEEHNSSLTDQMAQLKEDTQVELKRVHDEMEKMEIECGELRQQNRVLLAQFEASIHKGPRSFSSGGLNSPIFSSPGRQANSDSGLSEIIHIMKREKDNFERDALMKRRELVELETKLNEANSHIGQLQTNLEKERIRNEQILKTKQEHDEILQSLAQLQTLNESNRSLRLENEKMKLLQIEATQLQSLSEQKLKLVSDERDQLLAEVSTFEPRVKVLEASVDMWKTRATEILAKFHNIDPVEYEKVKQSDMETRQKNEQLESELEKLRDEIAKNQDAQMKNQDAQEKIQQLNEEIEKYKKEIEDHQSRSNTQKAKSDTILRTLISKDKKSIEEIAALKAKCAALEAKSTQDEGTITIPPTPTQPQPQQPQQQQPQQQQPQPSSSQQILNKTQTQTTILHQKLQAKTSTAIGPGAQNPAPPATSQPPLGAGRGRGAPAVRGRPPGPGVGRAAPVRLAPPSATAQLTPKQDTPTTGQLAQKSERRPAEDAVDGADEAGSKRLRAIIAAPTAAPTTAAEGKTSTPPTPSTPPQTSTQPTNPPVAAPSAPAAAASSSSSSAAAAASAQARLPRGILRPNLASLTLPDGGDSTSAPALVPVAEKKDEK